MYYFSVKLDMQIYGTIAYSEGHNGGRAGPVDGEDSVVKTSLSFGSLD